MQADVGVLRAPAQFAAHGRPARAVDQRGDRRQASGVERLQNADAHPIGQAVIVCAERDDAVLGHFSRPLDFAFAAP